MEVPNPAEDLGPDVIELPLEADPVHEAPTEPATPRFPGLRGALGVAPAPEPPDDPATHRHYLGDARTGVGSLPFQRSVGELPTLTLAEARQAVSATLNQAATFSGALEMLASRLPKGSQHRALVEQAAARVGESYNTLAACAGVLAIKAGR